MNTQATPANQAVDFSKSSAVALAKAGWPVLKIVHKGGKKMAVFLGAVGSAVVYEERVIERGYPALEAYINDCLPKPAPKKVPRHFGTMRPGKTARDHASRTRGSNPTGHSAIRGPQKGASGGKPKKSSQKK